MSTTASTFTDDAGIEWNIEKYLSRVCIERWANGERIILLSLSRPEEIEAAWLGLDIAGGWLKGVG